MGTRLSVSLEDPEVSPRTDRPPTFDPLYGFPKGRKPREMKATWEEMDHWKLELGDRDYCAHLLINLKKCQRQYVPFSHYYCIDQYHGWQNCQYDDHILRMKEFERERRLLKRASRKKAAQEKMKFYFCSSSSYMERQRVEHVLGTLTDPVKLNRKLLPLMEECGKLSEVNAFGWALLAKLVYACDQEMLRTISSRIQKRLIAAAKQPISVPLLHFIRSFLVRFPWLKSFNEQTLAYICSRAVDFSVENCSEGITRLTSNIYALWAGTKYDYILIKTMKDMLNDVIVEEKNDSEKVLFRFETAVQRYLSQFISVIFNLHTEVMEKCSPGDKIAINEWLDIACESAVIVEIEKKDSIFRWLRTFLLKARSCAHLAVRRISSFISDCCYPSEAYYEAVKEYVQLGPNLSVNTLFRALIRSARCQLNSQASILRYSNEYGKAYAEALGAMLELRSYLLDVQDVIALQYSVCQEVFQKQNCRPALSLLNSLLAMNNELVPSPIQIAQSIFSCSENWCDEVRVGRALCSSISRPRIQMIIPQEDLLKKLSDTVMSDQQIHFDSFQNSTKLIMPKNSEVQSNSTAVNIGLNDDRIETYENIGIESAESAVRKRVYPSPENTSLKHVRIGSEHGEEIFSSKSGSSQSSKTLEITDEKQISNKIGYTLIEQKKFQDTAVVNAAAVKLNSDAVITELDKDVIDRAVSAPMRILITGAAGFIGSHVALELLEAGYDVICVDNFSNSVQDSDGNAVSLKRVSQIINKEVPFIFADCSNEKQLEAVFKKYSINGVIHLAGWKAVGESVKRPLDYYCNNLTATLVLLKLCGKCNVKNFVFSSSATVYGSPKNLPIKETDPVGYNITNPYGHTKYMIEQILMDLAHADKSWNIIILRYFNPVGAHPSGLIGEDPKGVPNNLMPHMSQVAIGKLPVLYIFGTEFDTADGTGIRDYIHVVDLARGHVAAFNYLNKQQNFGCEVYNLGTGKGYSVLEMVAAFEKATGRKVKTENGPPRPGDIACIYCDPLLAAQKLGWKCQYSLEEMCLDLWNWQVKNPNGYNTQ